MKLSPKQRRFTEEYLVDLCASRAAIRAGYSPKTAYSQGQRLLKNVEVKKKIDAAMMRRSEQTEIDQDQVLREHGRICFSDVRRVIAWGPDGVRLIPSGLMLKLHGLQIRAMNAHDIDLWLSYCTDDFEFDYVPAPPPMNKEETKADFEGTYLGLPDFHVTPDRLLVSGNIIADEKSFTGTHQGEFLGIPATGNSIHMPVLDIFEFEGSRLRKVSVYLDAVSMMVQLGVMPAGELPPLEPSYSPLHQPASTEPLLPSREIPYHRVEKRLMEGCPHERRSQDQEAAHRRTGRDPPATSRRESFRTHPRGSIDDAVQ